jgi:chaperonin GroEL (HSP60 family)
MAVRSKKAVAGNGVVKAKKLSTEALKTLDDNAVLIVRALYNSTLKGHVLSAKLLVALGEGNVDAEDAIIIRPLRSIALELANEAQWQDENLEPVA